MTVYFSSVAMSAVNECYLSPSAHVVHVDFGAWWVILPSDEGKQFTLQPKFTLAGLSCHFSSQFVLTKWYQKGWGLVEVGEPV